MIRRQNLAKQKSPSIAVYPGSFDPITLGHLDIVRRATRLFDKVIIGVADPLHKEPTIPIEERLKLVNRVVMNLPRVEVAKIDGLLVDFVKKHNGIAIIRGLRAVSDFEYEFKMAWMNRRLCPDVETIFLIPSEEYAYLASSLVREIAFLGGDISHLVPDVIAEDVKEFLNKRNK